MLGQYQLTKFCPITAFVLRLAEHAGPVDGCAVFTHKTNEAEISAEYMLAFCLEL